MLHIISFILKCIGRHGYVILINSHFIELKWAHCRHLTQGILMNSRLQEFQPLVLSKKFKNAFFIFVPKWPKPKMARPSRLNIESLFDWQPTENDRLFQWQFHDRGIKDINWRRNDLSWPILPPPTSFNEYSCIHHDCTCLLSTDRRGSFRCSQFSVEEIQKSKVWRKPVSSKDRERWRSLYRRPKDMKQTHWSKSLRLVKTVTEGQRSWQDRIV